VSPASLTFSGTTGGANPASQSLSISNSGGGTLSWTASDNQTWLTVSPTSGTAPSTATVSVNLTGLAAGTYNGTITISATGATNTPLTVPVTLTVTAPTTELLTNGAFDGSVDPWMLSGNAYWTNTTTATGGYLYLGSVNSATGQAYQTITIPATATTADLTFKLRVYTLETSTTVAHDKLFVEVRDTSGALLTTLATYSNLDVSSGYVQRGPLSLLAYKGQTVRVQFRVANDASLASTFRIDDASVR
jgi:hypothetical protein